MEEGDRDGAGAGGEGGGRIPEQEIHPGTISQENLQNEQHQHPLLNELILENVLKYVGAAGALSQARLVNTIWYDASLPLWRKLELPIVLCLEYDPIYLACPHLLESPYRKWRARNAIPMADFLQSLETEGGGGEEEEEAPVVARGIKQHTIFELRAEVPSQRIELRAQAAPQPDYNLLESFWNQFGEWMTKLTLWDFYFPDLELVREVVLSLRTPNLEVLDVLITMGRGLLANKQVVDVQGEHVKLKALKIGIIHKHNSGKPLGPVQFPFPWDALLVHYPKLESLNLHAGKCMAKEVKPCLTAIRDIRREDDRKLASLKEFSWFDEDYFSYTSVYEFCRRGGWNVKVSWDVLGLLKDCNLDLTSLGMLRSDVGRIWRNEHIFEALATYRTTLRELSLYQDFVPLQLEGLLPLDMTQLQYVCLAGVPGNMKFLKSIPPTVHTLKILQLSTVVFTDSLNFISRTKEEELTGLLILSSLKTFCFANADKGINNAWTRGDMARLAGWMPNLTRLEMELTNEAFTAVCQSLPNLKQLRIYGEEVGDKGITGEQVVEVEGGGQQEVVVYEQPNLSSLRKLQSFVIDNRPHTYDTKERITQVSVHHGFLKLPLLEKLILKTNWLVTPEAKSLLEERIQFAKVAIYQQQRY